MLGSFNKSQQKNGCVKRITSQKSNYFNVLWKYITICNHNYWWKLLMNKNHDLLRYKSALQNLHAVTSVASTEIPFPQKDLLLWDKSMLFVIKKKFLSNSREGTQEMFRKCKFSIGILTFVFFFWESKMTQNKWLFLLFFNN